MNREIKIRDVSKVYRRYPNKWARLIELFSGGRTTMHTPCWALKDINFTVPCGQSVGIIGQNGAGKSTLLKILTGTTMPTTGEMQIDGRVAALLELGMGFHSGFSGRANAVLTCKMMGLEKEEIQELMPEIIAFSELGDYIDQPVRVYSTGMHVRLAFSAATAIRPEILIVDEALSVGDAYFQHKCMRRIRSFKEKGTSLLFVSHDPVAVKSLCERAILLDQGKILQDGKPLAVLDYYNSLIAQRTENQEQIQQKETQKRLETRSGSGQVRIRKVTMAGTDGVAKSTFQVGDRVAIQCVLDFKDHITDPSVGMVIRDRVGNEVFGTNTYFVGCKSDAYRNGDVATATFRTELNIGVGHYSISVAVHKRDSHIDSNYDWWDQCLIFRVVAADGPFFVGLASLPIEAEMEREA